MKNIPDVIDTPIFLKFVDVYTKRFIANKGFGRWLHEYQDMEARGLFKPAIIKELYKKILLDTFYLGFIREQAVYYIGVYAQDAAEAYMKNREEYMYKICLFTGEIAVDDDGDEYTNLEYEEASEICKSLNEEAEEELFIVKKM
jgi:hypothetical protein